MSANFHSGDSSIIPLQKMAGAPESRAFGRESGPDEMLASLSQTLGTLRAELRSRTDRTQQLEIELAAAKAHQQATLTELQSRLREANERANLQSTQLTQDVMALQVRLKSSEEEVARLSSVAIKLEERERQAQALYREVQRLNTKLKDDEVKQWEETERSRQRELALEAVRAELSQESEEKSKLVLKLSSREAELERVREELKHVQAHAQSRMVEYKEHLDRQMAFERGRYREAIYRHLHQQYSQSFGKLKGEYVSLGTRYQQLWGAFQERSKRLERLEVMAARLVRSAHERMIRLRAKARQTGLIMEFFRQMGPDRAKNVMRQSGSQLKIHETRPAQD